MRLTFETRFLFCTTRGQGGGNPVYVHPFASSATEVFQRFTILMRSDASLRKFQTTLCLDAPSRPWLDMSFGIVSPFRGWSATDAQEIISTDQGIGHKSRRMSMRWLHREESYSKIRNNH